jgi:hypothetical protein
VQEHPLFPEVLRFLADRIDSVPHLEALLLLWENPERHWSEDEIAQRVYVGNDTARRLLEDLTRRRLIREHPGSSGNRYAYDPAWDPSGELMAAIADAYRRHLVTVANLIHAKASPSVQEFARAFKLKDKS